MSAKHSSILRVKFDDFAYLPSEPVETVFSEQITDCSGNVWSVAITPGGDDSESDDPEIGIYLHNQGTSDISAMCSFILRDALGNVYLEKNIDTAKVFEGNGDNWGVPTFVKRSEILDKEKHILINGALVVDVHLQIKPTTIHVPSNPFGKHMLELLEDEDDTDVVFKVETTVIRAHKLILKKNAPLLFEFCEGQRNAHIPINNTTPNNFRIVLRYVYGGDLSSDSLDAKTDANTGKQLIIAADRFGVPGLKMAVESSLVQDLILKNDNIADWLLFADAMTCPLLKEHAMSYFVARATDLVNAEKSKIVKESPELMGELMAELATSSINDPRFDITGRNMSVDELRKKLDGEGLDADGSREMLLSRLQEWNKRQRTE